MITNISHENLKGRTASHQAGPLTVITGGNFSGKSSVLQALALACHGYLPELGKTNGATFQLASGPELKVSVTFDGGRISRSWRQAGKTVKATSTGEPPPLAALLNAAAFTAANAPTRLALLAEAGGGGKASELEGLTKAVATAARALELKPEGETVMDRTESLLDAIGDRITASKARRTQFEKTLGGLTELSADAPTSPPEDTLTALHTATLVYERAADHERRAERAAEDHSDAFDALEEFLAANPHANVEPDPPQPGTGLREAYREARAKSDALIREHAEIQRRMAPVPDHDPDRLKALREMEQRGQARRMTLEDAGLNRAGFKTSLLTAKDNVRQLEAKIAQYEAMHECPVCSAPGESWKAKILADLTQQKSDIERRIPEYERAMAECEESIRILQEEDRQVKEELPRLEGIRRQAQEAEEAGLRLPVLEEELREANDRLLQAQSRMDAAEDEGAAQVAAMKAHGEWKRLAATVDRLEPAAMGLPDARAAAQAASEAMEAARAAHEAATPLRLAWVDAQAREADLARARKAAEDEAATLKALTDHKTTVEAERDKAIRAMFDPVIVTAGKVSEGILPTPLTLHPVNGQIGRWHGASFLPFDALSGTEQLLAVAALQIGLAGGGTVLLDEMGRLDGQTKDAFIARLERLVSQKVIEQVILVDHDSSAYDVGEWTRIFPA